MENLHLESISREDHERLLQSLGFPTMSKRQEDIHDACPETYKWILDNQSNPDQSSPDHPSPYQSNPYELRLRETGYNFRRWLETSEGIYWMSGKAGSGKSTVSSLLLG